MTSEAHALHIQVNRLTDLVDVNLNVVWYSRGVGKSRTKQLPYDHPCGPGASSNLGHVFV